MKRIYLLYEAGSRYTLIIMTNHNLSNSSIHIKFGDNVDVEDIVASLPIDNKKIFL